MRLALALIFGLVTTGAASAQHATVTGMVEIEQHGKRVEDRSGAVVWLTPIGHASQPEPATRVFRLTQKNKSFSPHLLVIPQGAQVEFPNKDPFFHNVFSLHDGVRFDLGLYERGASRLVRFSKPGASYIFCNIHPEMSAVIMVMSTRYYAVTDANGSYKIGGVPPGEYQFAIWYERAQAEQLQTPSKSITVGDGSLTMDLISLQQTPGIAEHHKNKYGLDYEPEPGYKIP
jgi:plastocyanin